MMEGQTLRTGSAGSGSESLDPSALSNSAKA